MLAIRFRQLTNQSVSEAAGRQFMKTRVRALYILPLMLAAMSLTNCSPYSCRVTFGSSTCTPSGSGVTGTGGNGGGGGGGGGGGTTISAANATTLVYFVDAAGVEGTGFGGTTFAPLTGYTVPALPSNAADNMAIVNKQFVYIPMGDTTIQAFSLTRATGLLTAVAGSPFSVSGTTGTADGAWSDPQGRFLFVGTEVGGFIWVFQINSTTGVLTETVGSPFTTGISSADIMTVDASGKFLYVGQGSASAGVAGFLIDQTTGALTPITGSPFNLSVAQIHASLTGEFLLGVAEIQDAGGGVNATDPHIYVYAINSVTGVPTAATGSPFATTMVPFDFAISPNGKYVYTVGTGVALSTADPIEGFSMDTTTGALTALSGSPFTSLPTPTQCQFDQAGVTLVCRDSGSSEMSVLTASPTTGALTHTADLTSGGSPFAITD